MDVVHDEQENTTEVFENDMALCLQMFCEEQNIKDMREASQSVWNAALMYIKRHVFNNTDMLKSSKPLTGYNNNNYNNQYSNLNKSNCNSYDIDTVSSICDYYIYLCMMYDKEVSIIGFCNLTGISQECIHTWGNNARELSTSGCEIYKKLHQFREESLSNKLATAKRNPVGILAILNRHYSWNLPGVSKESAGKQALTDAELPKVSVAEPKKLTSDASNVRLNNEKQRKNVDCESNILLDKPEFVQES